MSDPRFQLTMPDLSSGYRPPKSFTDLRLKLDPKFESLTETLPYYAFEGWYIRRWSIPGLVPFNLNQSSLDSALAPYLSQFSILATNNSNLAMSTILAQATSRASLDTDLFDKIRDVIRDMAQAKFWPDISVPGTKYADREQASIGKIDPSGKPQYDELSNIVPGLSMPPPSILPVKYTTRRFPFVNSADVIPSIYLDTDVLLSNQGRGSALIAGGSIKIDGKTSDGLPCSLLLVGGRDQVGGPAFSLTLQIGPDYDFNFPSR
jgi:hypothetical protein